MVAKGAYTWGLYFIAISEESEGSPQQARMLEAWLSE